MTPLRITVDPDLVDETLEEKGMQSGFAPITDALLQRVGTAPGEHPAILLIVNVDGKEVLAKTTLVLMRAAVSGMEARLNMDAAEAAKREQG